MNLESSTPSTPAAAPVKLPFPLQDKERVLTLVRRHWITFWPFTIWLALVAIIPPIILAWALAATDNFDGVARNIFWIVALVWIVFWGIKALLNWYRYNHDIWVVTNQRLVDSYRKNPFSHQLSSADLVNIQDLTVQRNGILQTAFKFGDIHCETAGGNGSKEFLLSDVPNPEQLQLLVDRERDRERMRRE
jgi:uncharacterized membrane protein YdbT with pleckstrin-like domain